MQAGSLSNEGGSSNARTGQTVEEDSEQRLNNIVQVLENDNSEFFTDDSSETTTTDRTMPVHPRHGFNLVDDGARTGSYIATAPIHEVGVSPTQCEGRETDLPEDNIIRLPQTLTLSADHSDGNEDSEALTSVSPLPPFPHSVVMTSSDENNHDLGVLKTQETIAHKSPELPEEEVAKERRVRYSHVQIRHYGTTIGDSPSCSRGPPLSLDWGYQDGQQLSVNVYETLKREEASHQRFNDWNIVLSPSQRCARLIHVGYTLEEVKRSVENLHRERVHRGHAIPFHFIQEAWLFHLEPILSQWLDRNWDHPAQQDRRKRKLRRLERQVRNEHSQSQSQPSILGSEIGDHDEEDASHLEEVSDSAATRTVMEGLDGISTMSSSRISIRKWNNDGFDEISLDPTGGDGDQSSDRSYGIMVDRKQRDKAMEIKLWSLQRPHMRAFHGAWFSFFVAFFGWFSITPLLGEIKKSLDLTNEDIWTSALVGAASTFVMRVVMGPLCDTFGARMCMAFTLMASAIPIACTGFINGAVGLSVLRLFVGIAGSSFVACQYWTSDMFTREIAGTANAIVAGWGNLGGGVAQLIIGSVLFPVLRLIYGNHDEDFDIPMADSAGDWDNQTSELAWRTVFLFPALLAIATGLAIIFYCDDSPTGSYQNRIRNETLVVKGPMESFCSVCRNRNVCILALQYAGCFGVEVTMTNATALYFQEEFGYSTAFAAGIASLFGFMHLFARSLGGFCSDWLQSKYGVQGRLRFQMATLIVEGAMIGVFPFAQSLGGSIVALVVLSIVVQSAEGSTFGIVPYVHRRFTGSVVGVVGGGGTMGGVIFSVFFVYFPYRYAFLAMGAFPILSAFLTCLLDTETFVDPRFAGHVH